MLKILQVRLQQYVNCELPDVQDGLKKAEEPEIKSQTSAGSLEKQESARKNIYFVLLTMPKPMTVWITTNFGKLFKKLTCLIALGGTTGLQAGVVSSMSRYHHFAS